MKQESILLIYGEGGHKAQMNRLYKKLNNEFINDNINFIGVCENNNELKELKVNYSLSPLRDKYSYLKTFYLIPKFLYQNIKYFFKINKVYNVKAVISTGPGISLILSILFKLSGTKIIFLETWSRFEGRTMTGKIMYKFADLFYIQNKSLQKLYPNATYGGLL